MANTIYTSFADPSLAEKAVGALLDYGARAEDISLVQSNQDLGRPPVVDPPIVSSTSGQDYINRDLDDPAGLGRTTATYTDTGGTETWQGEHTLVGEESDRIGYVGTVADTQDFAKRDRVGVPSADDYERAAKEGISTTTAKDAGAGAAKGLAWGVGVGVLAGLAALTVPGVGLVIGGGALATAIGGLVATSAAGAVAGAVTGYLKDQGVEEHVAARYEDTVRGGGALMAVTVPTGQVDEVTARQIIEKYGGANVTQYASRGYIA